MTLKNYLILMGSTTVFIWGLFAFVVNSIDPTATNWLGFLMFYLALFLALSGTTTVAGFFIRFKILKHELIFNSVKVAFRQSFLFAGLATAILYLMSQKLFSWFNLALLIIIVSVMEYLFVHSKQK